MLTTMKQAGYAKTFLARPRRRSLEARALLLGADDDRARLRAVGALEHPGRRTAPRLPNISHRSSAWNNWRPVSRKQTKNTSWFSQVEVPNVKARGAPHLRAEGD